MRQTGDGASTGDRSHPLGAGSVYLHRFHQRQTSLVVQNGQDDWHQRRREMNRELQDRHHPGSGSPPCKMLRHADLAVHDLHSLSLDPPTGSGQRPWVGEDLVERTRAWVSA